MPYFFLEHTADIRMKVSGSTLEELFHDALLGMVATMKPAQLQESKKIKRKIKINAQDTTALLIDFLNEALVWMHTEREAYTDARFMITEGSLEAELEGYRADSFNDDIKAVTYHEANVKKDENGIWTSNIIFDI